MKNNPSKKTLNVCGLNRKLQYNEFTKHLSSFDVLCLTKTKTDDTYVLQIPGFSVFLKNMFRDALVKYVTVVNTDSKYIFLV